MPEGAPLPVDMDGNALTARFVAGRTRAGMDDVALSPAQRQALAEELASAVRPARRGELGKDDLGAYIPESQEIIYSKGLKAGDRTKVVDHELGHLIADRAGLSKPLPKGNLAVVAVPGGLIDPLCPCPSRRLLGQHSEGPSLRPPGRDRTGLSGRVPRLSPCQDANPLISYPFTL